MTIAIYICRGAHVAVSLLQVQLHLHMSLTCPPCHICDGSCLSILATCTHIDVIAQRTSAAVSVPLFDLDTIYISLCASCAEPSLAACVSTCTRTRTTPTTPHSYRCGQPERPRTVSPCVCAAVALPHVDLNSPQAALSSRTCRCGRPVWQCPAFQALLLPGCPPRLQAPS